MSEADIRELMWKSVGLFREVLDACPMRSACFASNERRSTIAWRQARRWTMAAGVARAW